VVERLQTINGFLPRESGGSFLLSQNSFYFPKDDLPIIPAAGTGFRKVKTMKVVGTEKSEW